MIRKFSEWIVRHRHLVLGILLLITAFFSLLIFRMQVKTQFEDLLPKNHPYIKVHQKFEKQLGAPYKVLLMLTVKEGDIYTQKTLQKAKEINDQLDLVPGVNHNQIYSIASRKIKKVIITADGIITQNFMDKVPANKDELDQFKATVRRTSSVFRVWVSPDEKCLRFSASFIPDLADPKIIFEKIRELKQKYSDADHEIYVAGEPILTGWVYNYQRETFFIFGLTLIILIFLLWLYFKNWVGVIVPTLATILGGIWGIGFGGLLGYNLEPLTLVIPMLLVARTLAHSVQITDRYFEWYAKLKDVKAAAIECSNSMLPPGLLGIITDGTGIILIAVAPIPMMQKMAYICGFWAFGMIFNTVIFTPLMVSFFKPPKNIAEIISAKDSKKGILQKILTPISRMGFGKAGICTFIVTVILFVVCGWYSSKIDVGDIHPGTPILWPNSDYNVAVSEINKNFPGTEELYIIFESNEKNYIQNPEFLNILDSFQRHMEKKPSVATTISVQDFLPPIYSSIYSGYFKWQVLPTDLRDTGQIFFLLTASSAPGDYDLYFNRDKNNANVIIWFKDHMGDTIREAMSWVKTFIKENEKLLKEQKVSVLLASGNFGLLAAINETVKKSQFLNVVLVTLCTFLFCAITYRSFVAALLLMIPLNLANVITLSIMKMQGIGLNLSTLPVISVGVGVGINYGIYLLSRICEEYQHTGEYSLSTITTSIRSTGKAIFFTAVSMVVGVLSWYFLSSMKFQAQMGLLLGIIMFINMVGALIILPALIYVFKPKFMGRVKVTPE